MSKKMTIEELKAFAAQFCMDGELKMNLTKEEDGYRFHFLEDDYIGDVETAKGEILRDYGTLTDCFIAYTYGPENAIGFIEHHYGSITKANVKEVGALCSLIGVELDVCDQDLIIERIY